VLNRSWILQTPSKYYGKVLDVCALPYPPVSYEPNVIEDWDPAGKEVFMAYTFFVSPDFVLMVVKPRGEIMKTWITLKSELFFLFIASVAVIFLVVFKLTDIMVKRIEESDRKREAAYHGMEYTNKLASIGRLAAGVAHEINNPLAIINEKSGLMKDLIEFTPNFPEQSKFLGLADSILSSVERCRAITHRLLGFARRMDVQIEVLELNELLREVLGFLEKEALHRNIEMRLQLADDLPRISSDRGQLQQVFLNIVNNAFQAVDDGGTVSMTSWDRDPDTVGVSIQDNGRGMSEETLNHVFEPFFTTKKGQGTGLGLSITYGIVKKLGGDIEVHSKEGQGTTFTVFLPKKATQGAGV
jgi:two-component system NtrC family sensor kinase